jgi:4-amino-4-deoxy-L-arabinose transferase-like glycosyltransferase
VLVLILMQVIQVVTIIHRESLTFDEDDHMFAGYMMEHTGDYGLNPEHPPLVKLLAALPMLGRDLWVPPLQGRFFKEEAYMDGRDWLARNDGSSQHMVFAMRLAAGLLALALSLVVFFAAREWFGDLAAVIALLVLTFDPNILAHSALVTTDMGVTLLFLASVWAFYRYATRPSALRLVLAGVAAGLLLATKHSGILLAPMLLLLIAWEIFAAPKGSRARRTLRLAGAFAAIVVIGVVVLWAFYGFRYAARPAGMALSATLANYCSGLSPFDAKAVLAIAHFHLLPESYLIGLVDVKLMAQFYPTYVFGKVYAHGQWWYFPAVILIKSTLGLLGLCVLGLVSMGCGLLRKGRELFYLLAPGAFYLLVAMVSGMNIGVRHILPLYAMAAILAGAAVAALAASKQPGARIALRVAAGLLLAHIVSALLVFPNDMAYANEAFGGPKNLHNLLSDANVDWGQQLYQVKQWQDRHPGEECWFAYFSRPEIDPATYGIHCHAMPTIDTLWLGGADVIPPVISGNVLISAGDLSGCEWPSDRMNPYRSFKQLEPAETIDYSVMVYRGSFQVGQTAALSRAINAGHLLRKGKKEAALALAREAVAIDPEEILSQTALGDAAASLGVMDEARKAWQAAIESARHLEPDAQESYIPDLEAKLKRL